MARMIQQETWLNEAVLPPAFIILGNTGDETKDTNTAVSTDETKKRLGRREQIIERGYSRTILLPTKKTPKMSLSRFYW